MVEGPIVRFCDFSPQLQHRSVSLDNLVYGIERFIIGLGKKVLLADLLGETVTTIFSRAALGIDVPTAWLGVIFFSFQINVYINLFIVFLVTGFWHDAGSVYIVWGITHGICIIIEKFLSTKNLYKKIPAFIQWAVTLLIVWLGWVLFNTGSLSDALVYYKQLFGLVSTEYVPFSFTYFVTPRNIFLFVLSLFGSVIMGKLVKPSYYEKLVNSRSLVISTVRYILICALFILCLISIISGTYSPFLYFQF